MINPQWLELPWLEQISIALKMFEPWKFYCIFSHEFRNQRRILCIEIKIKTHDAHLTLMEFSAKIKYILSDALNIIPEFRQESIIDAFVNKRRLKEDLKNLLFVFSSFEL